MHYRNLVVATLAFASASCTSSQPSEAAAKTAGRKEAEDLRGACPMSIREIYPTGKLARRPIVGPEHVASVTPGPVYVEGDVVLLVRLTPDGERSMRYFTENAVGEQIAVFCGDQEVSRPTISEPFGNDFQVQIRAAEGGA